ncbi:MAG: phosphoribosylamine--glycine ligase [Candidatus Puniceispirillaceae bacterium]
MHILIVGSGGREHALAVASAASPQCTNLSIAPGNAGMAELGTLIDIKAEDIEGLVGFAQENKVDLVIIGPEVPLVMGLADQLAKAGIAVFGPSAAAAQLEGSKSFARDFCSRHHIPQPAFASFKNAADAKAFVAELGGACVIKADGLAAGKGVVVCDNEADAAVAIDEALAGAFGAAGEVVLVEERIYGPEISAFALLDGAKTIWLASARDHKRAFDGDEGPNTGGMGAISPSPDETDALRAEIMEKVIQPVAAGMAAENMPYRGILYAGLMLTDTGPQVIEFNCRFGDPEAEVILPRLNSDFIDVITGKISADEMDYNPKTAVTIVLASKGYPGAYDKGTVIENGLAGLAALAQETGSAIFHAGTALGSDGQLQAVGGRVLAVTALGDDGKAARQSAYQVIDQINWPNGFCRRDIAKI